MRKFKIKIRQWGLWWPYLLLKWWIWTGLGLPIKLLAVGRLVIVAVLYHPKSRCRSGQLKVTFRQFSGSNGFEGLLSILDSLCARSRRRRSRSRNAMLTAVCVSQPQLRGVLFLPEGRSSARIPSRRELPEGPFPALACKDGVLRILVYPQCLIDSLRSW